MAFPEVPVVSFINAIQKLSMIICPTPPSHHCKFWELSKSGHWPRIWNYNWVLIKLCLFLLRQSMFRTRSQKFFRFSNFDPLDLKFQRGCWMSSACSNYGRRRFDDWHLRWNYPRRGSKVLLHATLKRRITIILHPWEAKFLR